MIAGDTIAAVSSATGPAARMIVRLSGPRAVAIVDELGAREGGGASAVATSIRFAGLMVPCWVYRFLAPRSYTGEDVAELHVPGNPLLVRMLLDELQSRGARLAEPGEFTARAYFNGRMDLTEAEGVAATISARGERELLAARQLMAGELARRLRPMMDQLAETLALVEVGIDFSEEDVTFLPSGEVARRAAEMDEALRQLVAESARFERLAHEPQIVLVGRPNAGKSTLLNALAGMARAVVSPVAGTTRDVLSADVPLEQGMVRLIDVAGLEEALPPAGDRNTQASIERQMRARALGMVEAADLMLLVQDSTDPRLPLPTTREPDLIVLTKIDLLAMEPATDDRHVAVSAATGRGMDDLRRRLAALAFSREDGGKLALNARHLEAIDAARSALGRAGRTAMNGTPELVALELREALDALGHILGQITPDDLLGRVFASFCIGK